MLQSVLDRLAAHDGVNFTITNRLPRRLACRAAARLAAIEQPLVARWSIRMLERFAGDLRLHEAARTDFRSLRDCFLRELKPNARPIDPRPDRIVCPCDGIVVACGRVEDDTLVQVKGLTYTLDELLLDRALAARYRNGAYVTLRLTAAMYHHFHAPCDAALHEVHFIPGDTWNVNPATLARVPRVYCRNTRVVAPLHPEGLEASVTLVAVGAILVSSVHLAALPAPPHRLRPDGGRISCETQVIKGEPMGHFEHGSTIVVLATSGLALERHVSEGTVMRVGQALWRAPRTPRP